MDAHRAGGTTLGPFDVVVDPAVLARFLDVGGGTPGEVPTTFPIVWLAHPSIRAAIESCANDGEVAFHEEQTFEYREMLEAGASYRLSAEVARRNDPSRIEVSGQVARAGETVLTMRTLLRLVSGSTDAVDMTDGQQ